MPTLCRDRDKGKLVQSTTTHSPIDPRPSVLGVELRDGQVDNENIDDKNKFNILLNLLTYESTNTQGKRAELSILIILNKNIIKTYL